MSTRKILDWSGIERDYKKGMTPTHLAALYDTTPATISVHMTRSGLAKRQISLSAIKSRATAIASSAVEHVIQQTIAAKCQTHLNDLDAVRPLDGHNADSLAQACNTTYTIAKTASTLYGWSSSQAHQAQSQIVNVQVLAADPLPSCRVVESR